MTRNSGPRRARSPQPRERWHSFVPQEEEEEEVTRTTRDASYNTTHRHREPPIPVRRAIPATVAPYGSQYTSRSTRYVPPTVSSVDSDNDHGVPIPTMRPFAATIPPYGSQYAPEAVHRQHRGREETFSPAQAGTGATRSTPPSPERDYIWEGGSDLDQLWETAAGDRNSTPVTDPLPRPDSRTPRNTGSQRASRQPRTSRDAAINNLFQSFFGFNPMMGSAEDTSNASDQGSSVHREHIEYVDDDSQSDISSISTSSCTSSVSSDVSVIPIWSSSERDIDETINDLRQEYDAHQGRQLTRGARRLIYGSLLERIRASGDIRRRLDLMQGPVLRDLVLFLLDEIPGRRG